MIEVEIKLPVKELSAIQASLQNMGFELFEKIREEDHYYDTKEGRIRNSGQALRIRTQDDLLTGAEDSLITFKGKKLDAVSMTREEYETWVGDPEIMDHMLQSMGFSPVEPAVIKVRTCMRREDIHACLDEVEGLGEFLELEIVTEEEKREDAFERIEMILKALGYEIKDTVTTSYLSMLMGITD